jgi:hypothetical protein
MGWKVDAGVVSAYQTKNGSLSPRFSKTRVIRVGLALGVAVYRRSFARESMLTQGISVGISTYRLAACRSVCASTTARATLQSDQGSRAALTRERYIQRRTAPLLSPPLPSLPPPPLAVVKTTILPQLPLRHHVVRYRGAFVCYAARGVHQGCVFLL